MKHELIYKILLLTLFVGMNAIRFYYQRRYKSTHTLKTREKRKAREQFLIRLMFLCLSVPGLLWLFTDLLAFGQLHLSDSLRLLGYAIGLLSMFLFWHVHSVLGDNWSPVLEIREAHHLVVAGAYRWLRHPMYSAMLLWPPSFALICANWFYGCTIVVGLIVLLVNRIPDEEKLMLEEFGEQYSAYIKRTKRLIPFVY